MCIESKFLGYTPEQIFDSDEQRCKLEIQTTVDENDQAIAQDYNWSDVLGMGVSNHMAVWTGPERYRKI